MLKEQETKKNKKKTTTTEIGELMGTEEFYRALFWTKDGVYIFSRDKQDRILWR